jgi:hypothetical protein
MSCSDVGRVLVLNDPPAWRAAVDTYTGPAGVYDPGNTSMAGTVHVVGPLP